MFKENKLRATKFLCIISGILLLMCDFIVALPGLSNERPVTFVSIVVSIICLLLYVVLYRIDMFRTEQGYSPYIRNWKQKCKEEKSLFYYEISYLILSCITGFAYVMSKLEETRNIRAWVIFVGISILTLRMSKQYSKIIQGAISRVIVVLSIIGIFAIATITYKEAWDKCAENEIFYFQDIAEYKKCKSLYNEHGVAYVVLSSGNNTAEIRDLTDDEIEVYYAESEKEFNEFIENNTMGIGVDIPVLSGGCSFDKTTLSVKYGAAFDSTDIRYEQKKYYSDWIRIYLDFELFILSGAYLLSSRENSRENK